MAQSEEERATRRDSAIQESFLQGAQVGFMGIAIGIAAVSAASAFIPRFKILNVGARTALAISPGVFAFVLTTEQNILKHRRA